MRASMTSGWLFKGAELSGSAAAQQPPSGIEIAKRRIAMVRDEAAIRQAIVLLLTTIPGERVMRPDYGCPLHRLMFSPNDATTAGLAIHYVRQALLRYEPRVDIVSLDARSDSEDETVLIISLLYRIRATNRQASLEFGLDLNGGGG